ncbi:MAG: tryptophan synthase subunit alpha [Gemmatimonadota bacterium]|nr:tryptophan synthase subunit alpha [Gemmatimonadota bacterium]
MTTSSNRIDRRFAELRAAGRKALVCYVTGGHPDRVRSLELLLGLQDAGADVVEVGVPFSDPLADGPVIQASSHAALDGGMTFAGVLSLVAEARLQIPVVLFGYLNPFLAAGESCLKQIEAAGCDGVLITDLPVDADPDLEAKYAASPLAFVRLVAPTTPTGRMALISRNGSGFVYLVSRLGVTGMQQDVAPQLGATVDRLRSVTSLPICVGFGVTDARQAAIVARLADGVVVGSAIVQAADRSVAAAITLARSLRAGIDEAA